MSDIFGRSIHRVSEESVTLGQVKKMIRRSIESITNLDELKKIQTHINTFLSSQVSTGDKYKNLHDAVNDHIVKFNELQQDITDYIKTPIYNFFGVPREHIDLKIAHLKDVISKITEYDKEFNDHIKKYNQFRRNVINKFF